jgi:hypothetical protein
MTNKITKKHITNKISTLLFSFITIMQKTFGKNQPNQAHKTKCLYYVFCGVHFVTAVLYHITQSKMTFIFLKCYKY